MPHAREEMALLNLDASLGVYMERLAPAARLET
jgi:hypothetical protein